MWIVWDALIIGGGLPPYGDEDEGTGCGELCPRYVSITPIHLDLTAYEMMPIFKMGMELLGDNVL